jgi:catechol 2,3-dioxygenase-like lactoylglutathione lyase family enzyme
MQTGAKKEFSFVYAQGAVSSAAIVAMSIIYAWSHAAQRQVEVPNSPVAKYLDLMALQHIGIVVSNLTRSNTFYTKVLGGAEVPLSPDSAKNLETLPMIAFGTQSPPRHWRTVNFGSSLLVLWEALQHSPASMMQPQLAFRLRELVNVTEFRETLQQRLAAFDDFSTLECKELSVLAPDWNVVACKGPDNEAVQFWHANTRSLETKLEDARRLWSQVASDSRARDLWE